MIDVHAHRGFAGQHPENTVAAVRAAVAAGTDVVEVDVVPSEDGVPVVFHDARLDAETGGRGITDGHGYVWEVPTAELASLSVLDTDEGVPTLEEVCRTVPETTTLNVELKNPGRREVRADEPLVDETLASRRAVWQGFVDSVVTVLERFEHDVLFSSFADGALAAADEVAPAIPRAILYTGRTEVAVQRGTRLEVDAIHPPVSGISGTRYFDPEIHGDVDVIATAADNGWDVTAWTVGTWHEAHRLSSAGVDGIIADYPGLLAQSGSSRIDLSTE